MTRAHDLNRRRFLGGLTAGTVAGGSLLAAARRVAAKKLDTPGPSTARVERLDWHHRSHPLFPFDDDFEPGIHAVIGPGRGAARARR